MIISQLKNHKIWIILSLLLALVSLVLIAFNPEDFFEFSLHDTYYVIEKTDYLILIIALTTVLYFSGYGFNALSKGNTTLRLIAITLFSVISLALLLGTIILLVITWNATALITPSKLQVITIIYFIAITLMFMARTRQITAQQWQKEKN